MRADYEIHKTESRLLEAATNAFACEGMEAANLDSIATDARVSKSYIYSRYSGKSELYGSIRRRIDEVYYDSILSLDWEGQPPAAVVEAYISTVYDVLEKNPVMVSMMRDQLRHGTAIYSPDAYVRSAMVEWRRRLTVLLDRGRADGSFGLDVNADTFLFISVFLVMATLSNCEMGGTLLNRPSMVAMQASRKAALIDLVLRSLRQRVERVALPQFDQAPADVVAGSTKQNRVDRILQAAERCFGENGLERTTLSEISDSAGVSLQLIYYYFKRKMEVFTGVVDHVASAVLTDLLQIEYVQLTPMEAVQHYLRMWLNSFERHPHWSLLDVDMNLHGSRMKNSASVISLRNLLVRQMDAVFEAGWADGSIHKTMDMGTICFLGLALIPPALITTKKAAGTDQETYSPLELNTSAIVDFIVGATADENA